MSFRVLLVTLLVLLLVFFLAFAKTVSFESLYYFGMDLRTLATMVPAEYPSIAYTYGEGDCVSRPFRGGIAFANGEGIQIYAADGKSTLFVQKEMQNPRTAASHKHFFLYDYLTCQFFVYNPYAELYVGEMDFPIYKIVASEAGYFAVVTQSNNELSQVFVYDSDFRLLQRFGRASATIDVSFSDNGKWITILGVSVADGETVATADVFHVGSKSQEPAHRFTFNEEFPLALSFMGKKRFLCLTDRSMYICNARGAVAEKYSFDEETPVFVKANEHGACVALESDVAAESVHLLAFNNKGDKLLDQRVSGTVQGLDMDKEQVCVLTNQEVFLFRLDNDDVQSISCPSGGNGINILSSESIQIFYPTQALFLCLETRGKK